LSDRKVNSYLTGSLIGFVIKVRTWRRAGAGKPLFALCPHAFVPRARTE
jgi:hypothetical protein